MKGGAEEPVWGSGASHWPSGQTVHACAPHQASSGTSSTSLLEGARSALPLPQTADRFPALELFLQMTRLHAALHGLPEGGPAPRHSALLTGELPPGVAANDGPNASEARHTASPFTPFTAEAEPTRRLWGRPGLAGRHAPPTPAERKHTNTFNNAAAAPGFTGLLPAEAEQLLSGLALSAACALLVPDTLGAEPTLLVALFILGCLFVMHSQANLRRETASHREQDCKRALQKFVSEGSYQEIETSES